MTMKTTLTGSAAAMALLFFAPVVLPAAYSGLSPAQANVNVSINFNTFYRDLGDDGDWVYFRGNYVWVPYDTPRGWRPYMYGHWAWTRSYGWMWVSAEPFGWATYHYGRWGYSYDIGWYWVPGTRWAPAWVTWRYSDNDIVWAPLPPGRDDYDMSYGGDLPDYYWNCVPSNRFLDNDLSVSVVFDFGQRQRIFRDVRPAGNLVIQNNVVINNVINVNFVEKRTSRKVRTFDVVNSDKPGRSQLNGDHLTVFTGDVSRTDGVKPAKVKDFTEVKQFHAKRPDRITRDKNMPEVFGNMNGTNSQEPANGKLNKKRLKIQDNTLPQVIDGESGTVVKKKDFPKYDQFNQQNGQTLDGGNQLDQPPTKKKRQKPQYDQFNQQDGQTFDGGGQTLDGGGQIEPPVNKKKRQKLQQYDQFNQLDGQTFDGGNANGQPNGNGRKKHKLNDQFDQQNGQVPDSGGTVRKGKKPPVQCDPSVDPNCQPQQ